MSVDALLLPDPLASEPLPRTSAEGYLDRGLYDFALVARLLDWADDPALAPAERATFLAFSAVALDPIVARGATAGDGAHDGFRETVRELAVRQQTAHGHLVGSLAEHGIRIVGWSALTRRLRAEVRERYRKEVFPLVMPQASSPAHPFPRVSSLSLNLLLAYRAGPQRPLEFARIKVPRGRSLSRFLAVPSTPDVLVPVETVIAGNLDLLLPGAAVEACAAFRPTRGHRPGSPCPSPIVRLEVDDAMPDALRAALAHVLHVDGRQPLETGGFLGVEDWETVADTLPRR